MRNCSTFVSSYLVLLISALAFTSCNGLGGKLSFTGLSTSSLTGDEEESSDSADESVVESGAEEEDAVELAAPASVFVNGGLSQNTLQWSPVEGAASYNIYYSTSAGVNKSNGIKIANVPPSPYTHGALSNGTTYYYVITAAYGGSESSESVEKMGTPLAQRIIFTTSSMYTSANIGGLSGANSKCTLKASSVGLPGTFVAYASTSVTDAACNVIGLTGKVASQCGMPFAPALDTTAPIINQGLQTVANSQYLLVNASVANNTGGAGKALVNPIGYLETGASTIWAAHVQTGLGGVYEGSGSCGDMASDSGNGRLGSSSAANDSWQLHTTAACSSGYALFCVQQ